MRPEVLYFCSTRKKWILPLLAIALQACCSNAVSNSSVVKQEKKVSSGEETESGELSVRVDRAASAPPYQTQQLPKYFATGLNKAQSTSAAAGGGYGSSIAATRYYASGALGKPSSQLHSFQMSSPRKTGSSMVGDSYGSGYWSGANYNGGVEMPEMQWGMAGQSSYGSQLLQLQEQQPIYPTGAAGGYGAMTNMGGGVPASPYAGYLEKQPTSLNYQAMSLGNNNYKWTCSTLPMPSPSPIYLCVANTLEAPPICLSCMRMDS